MCLSRNVWRHIEDGDAVAATIRDDKGAAVGGDAIDVRLFAGSGHGDLAASIKIEDAECVGARVGHVGPMACWVDADERGQTVDRDGCDDPVVLRVDYGDRARLGVDDVDFVAKRIGGQIRWIGADLQGPVLAKVDEVEDGDGVGAAVTDVGELLIAGRHVGEAVPTAARDPQEGRANCCNDGSGEGESEGFWHGSESILESIEAACRRQGKGTSAENLETPQNFLEGRVFM